MPTTIQQSSETQKFQKTMGASIKSLFSPGSRTYFVLEHKSKTNKHNIGESANFMTDYVEIGRGNNYAVNFGDDCKTVSRPHAAIARNQNSWMLTPLSKTNATLLNGQKINGETLLKNGDEIQLSVGGPKFSFLIPSNPKVSGLNFTIRMKAAMNEAVRPYRKTISIISLLFVLAIGGLLYFTILTQKENKIVADNLKHEADSLKHKTDSLELKFLAVTNKLNDIKKIPSKVYIKHVRDTITQIQPVRSDFSKLMPSIYYIEMEKIIVKSKLNNESKETDLRGSGTGFLLNNGTFVTARHCVEPWLFEDELFLYNVYATNKNYTVTLQFTAYSPNGSKLAFTSDQFLVDRNDDKIETYTDSTSGKIYNYTQAELSGSSDWADCRTNISGNTEGLSFDKELSNSLQPPDRLIIFGYSFGIGAHENPRYSDCPVSGSGFTNGYITVSGRGFDKGNSGGPVFFSNSKGELTVIGIVSAESGNQGWIVPISSIK